MLERVSPSAECAAHTLLRCFERPIRSHRILEPSFWRYGGEYNDVPAWWPTYLDSIRHKGHDTANASQANITHVSMLPVTRKRGEHKASATATRVFAGLSIRTRVASSQASPVHIEPEELRMDHPTAEASDQNERISIEEKITPKHRRSSKKTQPDFGTAWNDFIRAGWKDSRASDILHLLASDSKRSSLERALRAYQIIPKTQRSAQDYYTAADVCIRLYRYSTVTQVIKEAIAENSNHEVLFKFLALCVSKGLWNMATDIWKQVGQAIDHTLRSASQSWDLRKQNFAGRYMSHFDIIQDFPSTLIAIANRLREGDPVLKHKNALIELCRNLTLLAVESESTMNTITSQRLLSLFAVGEQLELVANLHFAAIATISRVSDKGTKASLATLIYQDFKQKHPHAFVPNWVFGSLIGIYSAGRQPVKQYQSLLHDYKLAYPVPEDTIYLQIMRACATQGEAEFVLSVHADFRKHSGPKGPDDINSLIRAYAVLGDSRGAQEQFDKVQTEYKFKPSVRNWNSLILAYSRAGDYEKAYSIFDEMRSRGTTPDDHSWSLLVAIASKRGDTKFAKALVRQAEHAGVLPPLAMIGAVVDSCLVNDKPEEAWPLVIEATRAASKSSQSVISPIRLWNSLFRYYAFRSDSEAIFQTQERMKNFGVKADSMTYAALMTALVVQKRTEDAAKIIRSLHLSRTLSANEFHYSILIHGFAMEKKRDRAQQVYYEMLEKFSRASPSAELAMLHLQAARAEDSVKSQYSSGNTYLKPDFRSTSRTLDRILTNTSPTEITSSTPNPGFKRRSLQRDLEPIFFGSLIKFLQRNNAHETSKEMLETLERSHHPLRSNGLGDNPSLISRLDGCTHKLVAAVHDQNWYSFTNAWQEAIDLVLANCTPLGTSKTDLLARSRTPDSPQTVENIDQLHTTTLLPISTLPKGVRIMPAYRYILSRQISQCILALDRQQNHAEMIELVQVLRGYGLDLSNRNLNSLIQALCRSTNLEHGIFAYELFERQLLPNAPTWNVIRRGKWVHPSEEKPQKWWDELLKKKDKRQHREALERFDPGLAMPSYFTMVHLAIVWLRVSRPRSRSDHVARRRLEDQTPGTVKLVLKTPYLKDKVQGVLLRGQRVIGDHVKRPRHHLESPDTVSDHGSQLLIDYLSPSDRADLEACTATTGTDFGDQALVQAERFLGQINRSRVVLPSKGRLETDLEQHERIRHAERRKLNMLRRLRQKAHKDAQAFDSSITTTESACPRDDGAKDFAAQFQSASSAVKLPQSDFSQAATSMLERVAASPMHDISPLSAVKQDPGVRVDVTKRQALQMSRPSSERPYNVVLPRRLTRLRKRTQLRKPVDSHDSFQSLQDSSDERREPKADLPVARKAVLARRLDKTGLRHLQRMARALTRRYEYLKRISLRSPVLSERMTTAVERSGLKAQKAWERALAARAIKPQNRVEIVSHSSEDEKV